MCPNGSEFLELWMDDNVTFAGERKPRITPAVLAKKLINDAARRRIPLSELGFSATYTPEMYIAKGMTYTRDEMFP